MKTAGNLIVCDRCGRTDFFKFDDEDAWKSIRGVFGQDIELCPTCEELYVILRRSIDADLKRFLKEKMMGF